MNYKKIIQSAALMLAIFYTSNSAAQHTSAYSNPQFSYDLAIDLYSKAKYGSALAIFDGLATGENPLIQSGSEYYAALCSAQLLHPDATARFEKFISTHPQNARVNEAFFELGKLQVTNKDYTAALENFVKIDKFELTTEQQQELNFKSGYAYLKTDNLKKARENFSSIIEKPNKYYAPANYYYAHIAYSEKNYETALKHFERVSNDDTFKEVVNYYIVQIYSLQGRYDELLTKALPLLEQGTDKRKAEIARLAGDAYFHKNEPKNALKYFGQYLDTKPSSISAADNYEIGIANYQTGNYQSAVKYLQAAATNQDTLAQNAFYHLGDCYLKTNQKRFAFNAFNSAYKIKADSAITEDALFNYAKLAVELSYNPYNEAVNAIQEYLNRYPQSPRRDEGYGYLADLYLLTKNYKDAFISIQQVKKRNSRLDAAYQRIAYYRGIELFNESDFDGAIKLFKDANELTSDKSIKALSWFWTGEAFYNTARWDKAIDAYNKMQVSPGSAQLAETNQANYSTGYCYFKKKDYDKAASAFRKYISGSPSESALAADANLRLGDCFFMKKDFGTADDYYQKAASAKATDADYALFQSGMSKGVQGNLNDKIGTLKNMLRLYPRSAYSDDALYEIGLAYNVLNRDNDALEYYQQVVRDQPKSPFVKKSLLKSGLIYYNQNRDQEALTVLKRVATEYPGTPESKEAMASIKSIYVEMNQVDEYVDFAKKVPQADISRSEQDSLTYTAAENQYMNGNCEKATDGFNKYINKFPEGAFALQAYFYRSECQFRAKQFDQALKGYEYIVGKPRSRFTSNAAARAAYINHSNNNYEAALNDYYILEESADQPTTVRDAVTGQMQCNYALKKYGQAIQSAQRLLTFEKLPENTVSEAHLVIGRSAYALSNLELARKEFEETVKISKNVMAAEAKYMLAQIQFDTNKPDDCEKTIFALSENYASYDYWVAKGFLLLSDVYVKKGNFFQAKQTLQSIIDNYNGNDLIDIAKQKLDAIKDKS